MIVFLKVYLCTSLYVFSWIAHIANMVYTVQTQYSNDGGGGDFEMHYKNQINSFKMRRVEFFYSDWIYTSGFDSKKKWIEQNE